MVNSEAPVELPSGLTPDDVRRQLERVVRDPAFRSSRRSVQFLTFVVEKTLEGEAERIKERTIGVEVFGRPASYDTAADHVVRTAAIELRKRLAIYYGDEGHRDEVRMTLVPGSYIPRFTPPDAEPEAHAVADAAVEGAGSSAGAEVAAGHAGATGDAGGRRNPWVAILAAALVMSLLALAWVGSHAWHRESAEDLFWKPVLEPSGNVLLLVGDVPNGPPSVETRHGEKVPVIQKPLASNVPFADTVTIARVLSALQSRGKKVIIRPGVGSTFSDLREAPVVLIGAFNNEWSIRLNRPLRFSLALDPEKQLIYIRDSQHPEDRRWSQATRETIEQQDAANGGATRKDYALITRVRQSQTGHAVIIMGGLYVYGTQAAGEFISDPALLESVSRSVPLSDSRRTVQIVIETTVTDGVPGPPKVLAVSAE